ncbi:MAG: acyltransferase [Gammaproteobacteria bacterium]|nr:acyltransferase [Gammaproteobacteria bacterium]
MRIGYYQFRPQFGRVSQNLLTITTALREAVADLLVLPELAFTGYYFRDRAEAYRLAEDPDDSPVFEALKALCREKRFHIVTGFAERRGANCYNSAALLGPDGLIHVYRKLHLFHDERQWFDPGDVPLRVLSISGARVGIMVCYDWAFPEVARSLALHGAEIICHPANLVLSFCQQTMLTRSLENHVYAVTANRYGTDSRPQGRLRFTGRSQIAGPDGKCLHRAPAQRNELFVMDVDLAIARDKHITPLSDLFADRRPEWYAELTR